MDEKKLAILGLRGAGKSTFLAVLNVALSVGEKPSKWIITALDDETNKLVYQYENLIFNEGFYPDPTEEKGMLQFHATKSAELGGLIPGGNFKIIAGDVPGEAVKGSVSEYARFHDFYKEYVLGSSAIIFLLDPHEVWKIGEKEGEIQNFNYFPLFRSILTELKQQAPNVYLAFGVTKIDDLPGGSLPESILKNIHIYADTQDPNIAEQLAEFVLGKQAKDWIEQNFNSKNISWWLISATGFIFDGKQISTQSIEKKTDKGIRFGIRKPGSIKPVGVVEIVEWALNRIARDAENGRPSTFGKIGKWIEGRF